MQTARVPLRGGLNVQVDIQSKIITRTATGGVSAPTWTTETNGTVWAAVHPLSGGEGINQKTLTADATHLVTIDFYSGLTSQHRFKFGSRILNIAVVRDVESRGIRHECDCRENTK